MHRSELQGVGEATSKSEVTEHDTALIFQNTLTANWLTAIHALLKRGVNEIKSDECEFQWNR